MYYDNPQSKRKRSGTIIFTMQQHLKQKVTSCRRCLSRISQYSSTKPPLKNVLTIYYAKIYLRHQASNRKRQFQRVYCIKTLLLALYYQLLLHVALFILMFALVDWLLIFFKQIFSLLRINLWFFIQTKRAIGISFT